MDAERIEYALGYYRHLTKLSEFVQRYLGKPFTLSDAAMAIGISPSRLSHMFLEKTGTTYRDWVCYERVERAIVLLKKNDASICEIAAAVGYENRRTFERCFRKVTGITPAKYRKNVTKVLGDRTNVELSRSCNR